MCFLSQIFHVSACWVIQHFSATQDENEHKGPISSLFPQKSSNEPTNQSNNEKTPQINENHKTNHPTNQTNSPRK